MKSENKENTEQHQVEKKCRYTKHQIALRIAVTLSTIAITLAAYFAFGFFFDVFAEIVPILLVPLIVAPLVWARQKDLNKIAVIASAVVLMVLSVAAGTSVGVIATSKPVYGVKPCSGSVTTYDYSRKFMEQNYNINQKTRVYVWLPDGYTSEKKYPVVYVLDGDMLFDYAAVKAAETSKNGEGDVIVVGIGYGYWNSTFARGGIVWQDEKNLKGRWRDFCFADDTQAGYMPGTTMGGESKRGREYVDFVNNTVVGDIRAKFCVDESNSTIFGHSLGGGMAAYFLTQYDPQKGADNPFTNFVIVDNGYLDYYNLHFADLETAMSQNGNAAYSKVNVYRIWGGEVYPPANEEQYGLFERINTENWANVNNYFWIPEGANHSDTQTIGLDGALLLTLGKEVGHQTTL